ncbi:MAG: hypothetical protein EB127_12050 [Alphaproteobacteria bacterium]|nr:hypothetical protein [Alphaproteobacteria bacterium]
MKVNLFSTILTSIIVLGFIKVTHLLDKLIYKTHSTETYASALVTIHNSYAAKSAPEAKNPEAKGDNASESSSSGSKASNAEYKPNAYETNFLSKGYTEEELKVLMELSTRRDDLDKYQKELTLKESLLKATADKIDVKTKELSEMERKINDLMAQLEEKSNTRIKSLAKIYENMKASEAATIFDSLEMPLLLEIVRSMKEQKVAPIIAQMNPQKAKEISLEFAKISDSIGDIKSK